MAANHQGGGVDIFDIVQRVHSLPELRRQDDDWTGIITKAERKRRQNRLNQRAWRKRRAAAPTEHSGHEQGVIVANSSSAGKEVRMLSANNSLRSLVEPGSIGPGVLILPTAEDAHLFRELVLQALKDRSLHAPRLSSLHIIIRLNLLNAIADNAALIGFDLDSLCRDEFISPFCSIGPCQVNTSMTLDSCPTELQPTQLQRTVPHHPWIDLFPFPTFRDNILRALDANLFDDDDLCHDVLGLVDAAAEQPSIIVWTASSDTRGWEVNAAFLKKWGSLVVDCPEILASTNYWRTRRGDAAFNITARNP
ncbi:hypothetical protein HJFPF1_05738 [Paramyrothecium foliicola]|nr:hypothetical protein HJFPF1_05738 [Paramyrothecium foliicola]